MNKKTKLSVIIPAYNEEKTIIDVINKVLDVKLDNVDKEIIVVDDGSKDNTYELVKRFIEKNNLEDQIKLYKKDNGGKGSAVKYGIKKSTGDIIIIQDADLEYDPKDYPKLIEPIIKGETKVVYGSRILNFKNNDYSSILYLIGGLGVTAITNLLYFTFLTDEPTGYKVFHKDLKELLVNAEGNGFEWEPEITAKILKKGYKIKEVPISYKARSKKEGKKIKVKDGFIAAWTLLKWRFKNGDN